MKVHQHLSLLLLQKLEVGGEDHEVGEEGVEMAVEAQLHHLSIVGVVDVGQHVEQVAVDFAHCVREAHRELLTWGPKGRHKLESLKHAS